MVDIPVVDVKEVVQAGDTFLMHFDCPVCHEPNFGAHPPRPCHACKDMLTVYGYQLPTTRSGFRLLSGTRRKFRLGRKAIATLMEIQARCCAYCDRELEDYHVEHIRPLSVGGSNSINNLCLACPRCNLVASDMVFSDFYAKKLFVMWRRREEKL